jgi:amino acid adenylation domain-containing protein
LDKISIHDNFFQLGGHSLLATQVILGCRKAFSIELPLRELFKSPNIADLALVIDQYQNQESQLSEYQIIPQRTNLDSVILSFPQQRLWFLEQLEPGRVDYHIPITARLTGYLNIPAFQQALDAIVVHHQVLRTNYRTENGEPIQVILPPRSVELQIFNLQNYSPIGQEQEIKRLLQQENNRPFNLSQDLMLRVCLLQIAPDDQIIQLVMHHIASDGWSLAILFPDLKELYQAFSQNQPYSLPELPIQYADFAQWQRQYLQGKVLESSLAYWKQKLVGVPDLLSLPTDRPRPAVQSFRGADQAFELSTQVTQALKLLSSKENATLFMTVLTAFNILLYKYTGREDIVVGSPVANRDRQELEGLIGFFVNTVVFRTDVTDTLSFQQLLDRVREVALEAYTHQDLPFEMLVEALQPKRDLSYSPLFQVMLVLEEYVSSQTMHLPDLNTSPWVVENNSAKFDLSLYLKVHSEKLELLWVYNTDLFDSSTINRMSGHFQTLLEGIVANPETPISKLSILTNNEQQQLLETWNHTQIDYPQNKCIHQLFEAQVALTPDAVAVVFEEQQITYHELNSRANQLANYLRKLAVKPDSLVGICLERSLEMIVGMLGILKAGGAYVPIDPAFPVERISFMLEDAQVSVLLTQQKLTQVLSEQVPKIVALDIDGAKIAQEKSENLENLAAPENLIYVIFTSGSTGRSKAVGIEHQQLFNYIAGIQERLFTGVTGNYALISTFAADLGNTVLFPSLCYGGCLHIISKERASDPNLFREYCRKNPIDCLKIVPSHLAALLSCSHPETILPRQRLILGGEATSWDLITTIQKYAPNCQIFNHYGPTETTVGVLTYSVSSQPGEYHPQIVPLGRPLGNTEIYLLDRHQQPVPVGVPGEVHIGGAGVARGYLNRPDLTQEKFIPNSFRHEQNARLYKTGDLARYLPDGNIEYLGRIDNQVKIRGFRIELGEIEALLSQHPAVVQVVVIAQENAVGDKRLVAYIATVSEQSITINELRDFLAQNLPDYMIPGAFVMLETLPLTPNGKVDRKALPAPDDSRQDSEETFIAPRNQLELQLTQIWEKILGVQPISVKDNFFVLGGHSLLAVRLFAEIEKTLGKNLPLATLFQKQTIEELATLLGKEDTSPEWEHLVIIQAGKPTKPPLFCVHAIWGNVLFYRLLASYLPDDQPFYALQAQGLDGKKVPLTSIPEMASNYIKEMQIIQPHGPYYLGGFSLGGPLALEIAQQLQAQGEEIKLLAIFDTNAPDIAPLNVDPTNTKSETIIGRSISHLQTFLGLGLQERVNYLRDRIQWHLTVGKVSIFYRSYLRYIKRSLPDLRILDVAKANSKARRHYYATQVYSGKITLFLAFHSPSELEAQPLLGWDQIAAAGVDIYDIPNAIHITLMEEPNVRVLGEKLTLSLQQTQASTSSKLGVIK